MDSSAAGVWRDSLVRHAGFWLAACMVAGVRGPGSLDQ